MKALVELFAYAVVSGLIGAVACGVLAYRKQKRAAWVCAAIFFGGPFAAFVGKEIRDTSAHQDFEAARKVVQELCAQTGGDKIYRTVENVEGVFQMKARNPDPDGQWRDQYGMADPWGAAQGDKDYPVVDLSLVGNGYWFIEQQRSLEKTDGPPYRRRTFLSNAPSDPQVKESSFTLRQIEVAQLRSRYGYVTEDLSTREMRKHWIAGGRIKILDLQTKEVLAERTGYYLTDGRNWLVGAAYQNQRICPHNSNLGGFLISVLKPVKAPPTNEQIVSLAKD